MPMLKAKHTPKPRILSTQEQVTALLDKPQGWFRKNRLKLENNGFPRFDNLLEGWDLDAINLWIDHRSHIERPGLIAAPNVDPISPKEVTTVSAPPTMPKVYTVKMAAAYLGFSADTVYGLINSGELGCTRRPNCAIRIKEEHLSAYEEKFEQQTLSTQARKDDRATKADAINRAASTARAEAKARMHRTKTPKP